MTEVKNQENAASQDHLPTPKHVKATKTASSYRIDKFFPQNTEREDIRRMNMKINAAEATLS